MTRGEQWNSLGKGKNNHPGTELVKWLGKKPYEEPVKLGDFLEMIS